MNKAEPDSPPAKANKVSFADAQTLPPNVSSPHASPLPAWLMTVAGIVLILSALAGAWWQAPRPFPQTQPAAFAPGDIDWWRYPLESNPALRLPAIQGKLRGVHALADGKVWVVGEGGLILHSPDAGLTWRQRGPRRRRGEKSAWEVLSRGKRARARHGGRRVVVGYTPAGWGASRFR